MKLHPSQLNLFEQPLVASDNTVVRPFFNGEQLRDAGIALAEESANKKVNDWSNKADSLFEEFIKTHKTFQCEDFREWAKDKIGQPRSQRAYAGVIMRAKSNGLIKSIGWEKVDNKKAHAAHSTVWTVLSNGKQG